MFLFIWSPQNKSQITSPTSQLVANGVFLLFICLNYFFLDSNIMDSQFSNKTFVYEPNMNMLYETTFYLIYIVISFAILNWNFVFLFRFIYGIVYNRCENNDVPTLTFVFHSFFRLTFINMFLTNFSNSVLRVHS
jgi:hypothetical protein